MLNHLEFLKPIYQYAAAHSSRLSSVCSELEAYTLRRSEDAIMLSGSLVGTFLQFLIRVTQAQRVLEFGCFTGFSALVMAEATGDRAEVVTLDINPETMEIARTFWDKSPHGKKIKSIVGNAAESVETLEGTFDFIFIDADKPSYLTYLQWGLKRLSHRGMIVADNTLYSGEVLHPTSENAKALHHFNEVVTNDPSLFHILVPIRDGLHLITKKT